MTDLEKIAASNVLLESARELTDRSREIMKKADAETDYIHATRLYNRAVEAGVCSDLLIARAKAMMEGVPK